MSSDEESTTTPTNNISSTMTNGQVDQQVQIDQLPSDGDAGQNQQLQNQLPLQQDTTQENQMGLMMPPKQENQMGLMMPPKQENQMGLMMPPNAIASLNGMVNNGSLVGNNIGVDFDTTTKNTTNNQLTENGAGSSSGNDAGQLVPAVISSTSLSGEPTSNNNQQEQNKQSQVMPSSTNPMLGSNNQQYVILQQNPALAAQLAAAGGGGGQQQQQQQQQQLLMPFGAPNMMSQQAQIQLLQQQLQQQQLARAMYGQQLMNPAASLGFPSSLATGGPLDPFSSGALSGGVGLQQLAGQQPNPFGASISLPPMQTNGLDVLSRKKDGPQPNGQSHQKLIFPEMLHKMLTEVELMGKSYIISFVGNGKAFKIHKPHDFTSDILPLYYPKQSRLTSFKKQLHLYGFELIGIGIYNGCYFHPLFVKNCPDLCKSIRRKDLKAPNASKHQQGAGGEKKKKTETQV